MIVDDYDVLVVGAGPAGSVAAAALAKRGLAVLLVGDEDLSGDDGLCYDILVSGPAVRGLATLGLDPQDMAALGTRIETIGLRFDTTSRRDIPDPEAVACDRRRLRRALRQSAVDAGVTDIVGRVSSVVRAPAAHQATVEHAGTTTTVTVPHVIGAFGSSASWSGVGSGPGAGAGSGGSVGADGIGSGAPGLGSHDLGPGLSGSDADADGLGTGAADGAVHSAGIGCARRFTGFDAGHRMTLALAAPTAAHPDDAPVCAWILPGPDGTCTVGTARVGDRVTGTPDELMSTALKALALPVALTPAGPVVSAPLNAGFTPAGVADADILLVGDAAGLVNPFTGEGISYAVQSGLLAARCIALNMSDPDAGRRRYARELRATFVGYFETARHAGRRYHLAWRILAAGADSDHPFFAKGRTAILLPEGFSGLTAPEQMNITSSDAMLLGPFLLACDEVAITTIRREWPFLARLALAEDGATANRLRPAIPFFAALMAAGTRPDIGHATTAAALELALLGSLAMLGPAPPAAPGRGVDWALTATVLAGDFLLAQASRLVAESAPQISWSFAEWLAELTALRAGRLDPGGNVPAGAVYASLLEFPARIGAELGGSPPAVVRALRDVGHHCGHAFVHAEDVLALRGERTRLDTTLTVMLEGRFSAIPDSLDGPPVTGETLTADPALRSRALTAAIAACDAARRSALEAATAIPDPVALRILTEFTQAVAAPGSPAH